ncbi:hypothetical protein ABVT39_004653 [Epinephelus coioides]
MPDFPLSPEDEPPRARGGRGRGRAAQGAGPGAGRGTGRGRGRGGTGRRGRAAGWLAQDDQERLANQRQCKLNKLRAALAEMSAAVSDELIEQVATRHSGVLHDILMSWNPPDPAAARANDQLRWCTCQHC